MHQVLGRVYIVAVLILGGCTARTPHDRVIGSWEDLRYGSTHKEIFQFESDGTIDHQGTVVGAYHVIADTYQVELRFPHDPVQIMTLTLSYDDQRRTETLIINPDDIPYESARIAMFQKVPDPDK